MKTEEITIGLEVVRTKGDYVVGRTGIVEALDLIKNRAQIQWIGETKTWVSFNSIAPKSQPYLIIPAQYDAKGRRTSWDKYSPL